MFSGDKKMGLTDLIDIDFLQEFQDAFAISMGVASITVDENGPVTKPSNFTDFCIWLTRESKPGYKRCNKCDITWGKVASKKGEPVIYKCHTGLTDFAVPIIVEGKHIGSILGGQVLTEKADEEHFREVARELGIDEDKYIEAVRKIKIIPLDKIKAASHLLYIVANAISEIAHKNKELTKKTIRESLYIKIIDAIRSTLDFDETKQKIVNIIGKTLAADRCFIMEYDSQSDSFKKVSSEYLSSSDITSYIGADVNSEVPNFIEMLKHSEYVVIDDKKIMSSTDNKSKFKEEIAAIKRHNVHSAYAFPLFYLGEFLGAFAVHYVKDHKSVTDEDIKLMDVFANQISIAIHQARLFEELKQTTANQNAILNNIPFMAWLKDINSKILAVNTPYANMCNKPIEEIVGKTDFELFPTLNAETFRMEDSMVIDIKEPISSVDLIPGSEGERWHETFKSPVFDANGNVVGTVGMSRDITEKKEADLELLRRQDQILKLSERETLLRRIIETLRSSLDLDEVKHKIINEIGKAFNTDRCYFRYYNKKNKVFFPVDIEYLSSPDIKSLIGVEPDQEGLQYFVDELNKDNKEFYPILFDKNKATGTPLESYLGEFGIKADYAIPIISREDELMWLVLHYSSFDPNLGEEYKQLLQTITYQIDTAFEQIKLYNNLKQTAKREALLRKIVETIRMTFDIDTIKHEIVTRVGEYYNADRVTMGYYNNITNTHTVSPAAEYRSSENVKTFVGIDFIQMPGFVEYIRKIQLSKKEIIFSDLDKYLDDDNLRGTDIEKFYINYEYGSSIALAVDYNDIFFGNLVVTFTSKREIKDEDIDFIKSVAHQAGVAFYQAELFAKTVKQAERETLTMVITEKIRSSLDLDETLSYICEESAKLFNVQRSAITVFPDLKDFTNFAVRKEYKTSDKTKGIDSIPDFSEVVAYWGASLANKNEVMSFDNIATSDAPDYFKNAYDSIGVKSSIGTLIKKGDDVWGSLVLSEYNSLRQWSNDEKILLKTIADQIYIAINQAELYEKTKKTAEREKFLANVVTSAISTFDISQIKLIVKDVCLLTNADRCYFVEVDLKGQKGIPIDYEGEFLASDNIKTISGYKFPADEVKPFVDLYLQQKDLIVFDYEKIRRDADETSKKLQKYSNLFDLKSGIGIPLFYQDKLVAVLSIEYIKERVIPTEDDLNYLRILGKQAGMAFSQILLYQETKKTAEREKFSRNIIEILRNALDRETIKTLFVNNIGKYFGADRVFFSDYDVKSNTYLPVVKKSEYLSSPVEKSFVGYDWTDPAINEYTQPLLSKREILILSWDEYIKNNVKSPDFIKLFEDANVKSSYNFPVLYQGNLMGFFCIEFTQIVHEISPEDISSIRNICTQAGIALYHSDLYVMAQKSITSKADFIANVSDEFRPPLSYIVEHSEIISKPETSEEERTESLKNINKSGRFLLGLTEDIITLSKIESDDFRINYEKLDSYPLIMEVVNSIKFVAGDKNIDIETYLVNADINVDRKIFVQILYLILANIVKVSTMACSVKIRTTLENNKLILYIETSSSCNTEEEHFEVFEKFKQVDSLYPKKLQGFGISLSIVRKLVQLMNGTVNVESFNTNSYRFIVTLPMASGQENF